MLHRASGAKAIRKALNLLYCLSTLLLALLPPDPKVAHRMLENPRVQSATAVQTLIEGTLPPPTKAQHATSGLKEHIPERYTFYVPSNRCAARPQCGFVTVHIDPIAYICIYIHTSFTYIYICICIDVYIHTPLTDANT